MSIVMSGCVRDTISDNLTDLWTVVKIRINGDPCAYYDFKLPSLEIYDNKTLLLMELDVESQIRHKNNHPAQWKVIMRKGIPYLQVEGGGKVYSFVEMMHFLREKT